MLRWIAWMHEQGGTCNLRYDVENYVGKIDIILAMAPELYLALIVQHKTEQSFKNDFRCLLRFQ
jgi:hypothetical protein